MSNQLGDYELHGSTESEVGKVVSETPSSLLQVHFKTELHSDQLSQEIEIIGKKLERGENCTLEELEKLYSDAPEDVVEHIDQFIGLDRFTLAQRLIDDMWLFCLISSLEKFPSLPRITIDIINRYIEKGSVSDLIGIHKVFPEVDLSDSEIIDLIIKSGDKYNIACLLDIYNTTSALPIESRANIDHRSTLLKIIESGHQELVIELLLGNIKFSSPFEPEDYYHSKA